MLRILSIPALLWLLGCSPEPEKPEPPATPQVTTTQVTAPQAQAALQSQATSAAVASTSSPAGAIAPAASAVALEGDTLAVYKSPTCGCCGAWVDHMREADFALQVNDVPTMTEFKQKLGIPVDLQSCHTTQTADGRYYFEGHVPAPVVAKFLASPPAKAVGLAVPNMPVGSPGMEMGDRFVPYDVLVVYENGSTDVFARMESQAQQYN